MGWKSETHTRTCAHNATVCVRRIRANVLWNAVWRRDASVGLCPTCRRSRLDWEGRWRRQTVRDVKCGSDLLRFVVLRAVCNPRGHTSIQMLLCERSHKAESRLHCVKVAHSALKEKRRFVGKKQSSRQSISFLHYLFVLCPETVTLKSWHSKIIFIQKYDPL